MDRTEKLAVFAEIKELAVALQEDQSMFAGDSIPWLRRMRQQNQV